MNNYIELDSKLDGFDIRVEVVPDADAKPTDFDCYSDEDLDSFLIAGEWHFVGLVVTASKLNVDLGEASLWGVEAGRLADQDIDPLEHYAIPDLVEEALDDAKSKLARLTKEV
jgi:hypothetical protein